MNATKESIQACADSLGLTMSAEFVPLSRSRNAGEKHKTLNWKVSLLKNGRKFLTTDYSAGVASCPSYTHRDSNTLDGAERIAWECENGRASLPRSALGTIRGTLPPSPILPNLADVLSSLSMDASVLDHPTYETWAGEYGFDVDSRKGEATYRTCLEIALKMRAALGDEGMRTLAEAVQDY